MARATHDFVIGKKRPKLYNHMCLTMSVLIEAVEFHGKFFSGLPYIMPERDALCDSEDAFLYVEVLAE